MSKFYPVQTEDGSVSLFNTEVNDVYHSKIGAYTEALQKFVIPSGILEFVKTNNEVKILDMCFGIGYNSKVAVKEIWKINPDCKIHITAVENDPDVLAFSTLIGKEEFNYEINQSFYDSISRIINIDQVLREYLNDVNFLEPISEVFSNNPYNFIYDYKKQGSLHNIYYRSISDRNNCRQKINYNADLLDIAIYIEDGRIAIQRLKPAYDFIFHDPFTPSKLPTLWTVELFKEYHRLLTYNGTITTYSSSSAIRGGLIEAGFYLGRVIPVGRKSPGTIASKNKSLISNVLINDESELLKTNAGIPYYDSDFTFTNAEIVEYRTKIQQQSGRPSTSRYLKNKNL